MFTDVLLGSDPMRHDAIVIGSDEAACAAALEGSKHGLDILLIDDGSLSPDNLARRRSLPMHQLREAIVRCVGFYQMFDKRSAAILLHDVHLNALAKQTQDVAESQSRLLSHRLASNSVCVVPGPATLLSDNRVLVGRGDVREAPIIVVACGSRPRQPGRFSLDGRVVCDQRSIVHFEQMPRSLLTVGAEIVGCEFACLFAAVGTNVTLLDRRDRMLRYVDRDIIEILHRRMRVLGIDVVLHETIEALDVDDRSSEPHAVARLGSGRIEKFERVLFAAGESSNADTLGIAEKEIEIDDLGFIVTDNHFCTSRKGVYAVGGAISGARIGAGPQHGRAAMQHAMGIQSEVTSDWPITIYSIPEISMVGLTQEMCEHLEIPQVEGRARFEDLLSGQIRGDHEGMLKLVVSQQNRRLLGVHLIGSCARELVQIGVSIMRQGESVDVLANGAFSEPSLSEAYRNAALDCLDRLDLKLRR